MAHKQAKPAKQVKKAEPKPKDRALVARDLLDSSCPLHEPFVKWCKARQAQQTANCGAVVKGDRMNTQADAGEPSVRKARKFLALAPQFRQVRVPLKPAA